MQLKLHAIEERVGRTHGAELSWDPAVIDAIVARCTETDSGARTIDHLLTQTLLPELSEQVLDRLAERAEFDLIRIELDDSGHFSYTFSATSLSGTVREAAA